MDNLNFDEVDSLIPGTTGEPGARVFYIQARLGDEVIALKLEKEQVGMLGGYLGSILASLGSPEPDRDIAGLIEPVNPRWTVGSISVGVDEENSSVIVTLDEFDPNQGDDDEDDYIGSRELSTARFTIHGGQAAAFAEAAAELMAAGRPPCRLCGAPMEPSGHACPRWN